MGQLTDFLMQDHRESKAEAEVLLSAFPHPFLIHSITEAENKTLKKACEVTTFDKKTHRRETNIDQEKYNTRLIVACCAEPNFKDAALQEKYGVRGADALVDQLLKTGDYNTLLDAILEVNGFYDGINEAREEAKN